MKLSVIIPVYNAEKYLKKAVLSALEQRETGEVILVEDGSPDRSLQRCQELSARDDRIKLYQHPGGQNKGAGASRNLGVKKASNEWVAFLDADDFYLVNRFLRTTSLLSKSSDIDGVYEAIGTYYYSEKAKGKWEQKEGVGLTAIKKVVQPDRLFETLLANSGGYIHLDGLVVRKKCLIDSGLFPNHLRLHQDTALILQLAATCNLVAGNQNDPVALRGIHDQNRILSKYNALYTAFLLWTHLLLFSMKKSISCKHRRMIVKKCFFVAARLLKSKLKAKTKNYD